MVDIRKARNELRRLTAEEQREPHSNWKRWGPFLAERQWGTVREDYSEHGEPWNYFTHDDATWRAYRWGEDGILGLTDRQCRLCFAISLWNGEDPILKERLYGLSGPEGNHGEDVKEAYYYLDSTPTHSYMKGLYKYPQTEFPYDDIRAVNQKRSRNELEYELTDTTAFDNNKYFDVFVEYAKEQDEDILIRVRIVNRSQETAPLTLLPTFWFRNYWTHKNAFEKDMAKPRISLNADQTLSAKHPSLGDFRISADTGPHQENPKWLFTENETNTWKLEKSGSSKPSCKDAFHQYIVEGKKKALNLKSAGTKAGAHYDLQVPAESEVTINLRLTREDLVSEPAFGTGFEQTFSQRIEEADAFYEFRVGVGLNEDERRVLRQASAGLLWTKQFYCYVVDEWLEEVPHRPLLAHHTDVRNAEWTHLYNRDVISMPDKWEYPWYAAWDSAFHMIPFANLDINYAKEQLVMFLREWYMHPNGQMPAYEWNFSDVNPPVHAWACWRTYQMTGPPGQRDRVFLSKVFQKLLLNFTWWVNRKDPRGKHVFTGGFLGLDNIGVFDRSRQFPMGGHLEQADGTAWMAYYCSSMMSIAFELADGNKAYADIASKFFEHYVAIAEAMNSLDGGLWDEEDGFYYDHLFTPEGTIPLKIRSMVGIIPLFTVDVISQRVIDQMPEFRKRMEWFLDRRGDLTKFMTFMECNTDEGNDEGLWLLAMPTRERLERILRYLLDEDEFLSEYGIRSLSKYHLDNPFTLNIQGVPEQVRYVPGESDSFMFGGNSNWRGPIWFPLNYLLIEALDRYHQFYGDSLRVECPTGSGNYMNMAQVADEIRRRLVRLFLADNEGSRPSYARNEKLRNDPHWRDLVLFYEYFHGDTGRGLGASHQTGWTALVAPILQHIARVRSRQQD